MKLTHCFMLSTLVILSCPVAQAWQEPIRFTESNLRTAWADHYAGVSTLECVRFAPVGGESDPRVQVERVLIRYPDGLARTIRVFPLPEGHRAPTVKVVDGLLPQWDETPSVLDMHSVPGQAGNLIRQAYTNSYLAVPQSQPFDRPIMGFAPHVIARRLLDMDPYVEINQEGTLTRMRVREWNTAYWFDGLSTTPRLTRVDVYKPNGELATHEEYEDFRALPGYPGPVPFRSSLYINSGASKGVDGVEHPAGPRLHMSWTLHSAQSRQVNAAEFEPDGMRDGGVLIVPFQPGSVVVHTTAGGGENFDESPRRSDQPRGSQAPRQSSNLSSSWWYGAGAIGVLAVYAAWMWSRRRAGVP